MERQTVPLQGQPVSSLTSLSLSSQCLGSLLVSSLSRPTARSEVQPRPPLSPAPRSPPRPAARRATLPLGPLPHSPRIRSPQTPSWTLTPGAPSPSQETHPGRGQERGAPPNRLGARVRNPGAVPGREGTQEAAAKAPAAAAAVRRARDADSSPAGSPHPQKARSEQPPLPWLGGDRAARAALSAGAARARGAAGASAAAAALCAFLGRRAGEHETGRADAAAGAEVWPGNPNETPRQPAPRVPRRHEGARSAGWSWRARAGGRGGGGEARGPGRGGVERRRWRGGKGEQRGGARAPEAGGSGCEWVTRGAPPRGAGRERSARGDAAGLALPPRREDPEECAELCADQPKGAIRT